MNLFLQQRWPNQQRIDIKMGNSASANGDLVWAVKDGSADGVRNALKEGAEINGVVDGRTALHCAAYADLPDMVTLLLDSGADAGTAIEGGTALHDAAERGNTRCVAILLERGVPVDQPNTESGHTPLMWAALGGRTEAVKLLLEKGADRSLKNQAGKTAVDLANEYGHKEVAAALTS